MKACRNRCGPDVHFRPRRRAVVALNVEVHWDSSAVVQAGVSACRGFCAAGRGDWRCLKYLHSKNTPNFVELFLIGFVIIVKAPN